jgi:glycosyltransferase involved in cell wall biosynthesis
MNLLRAAAILQASGHDLHLVMIGKGITETDRLLVSAIHDHGLGGRVSLFGERLDIAELTPAVDIACLSSAWGEGFPNVLGEAMACGVPCVTTAVGDAAWVVAEGGRSVPARDPQALSDAIRHIMELEPESRRRIGKAERQRVLEHFSLAAIDRQYTGLYLSAIESTRRRKVRS